jgi:3-phosphoshikimate 1-carboxyvinyltransferase
LKILPAKSLRGRLKLPGDKSLSHRHLIRAALVKGKTSIVNLSTAQDVERTQTALRQLGVDIQTGNGETVVNSQGRDAWTQPEGVMDCGNSGTTARLMMGLLAGSGFDVELDGDESLRQRPMLRCTLPLSDMGASIETKNGRLPLRIMPAKLTAINEKLKVPSAQIKSALMLAALSVDEESTIIEPLPCRDHTERILGLNPEIPQDRGLQLDSPRTWRISKSDHPRTAWESVELPGDPSSAVFFVVAALLLKDSALEIDDLLLNPFRSSYLDWLEENGAALAVREESTDGSCGPISCKKEGCEPGPDCPVGEGIGSLQVQYGEELEIPEISGSMVPRMIDEIPALAALALGMGKKFVVRNALELRLKESDRIMGICRMARAYGAEVMEFGDGFSFIPAPELKGAEFDCEGDHRLAMAAWVLALKAETPSELKGLDSIAVSLPEFPKMIEALIQR